MRWESSSCRGLQRNHDRLRRKRPMWSSENTKTQNPADPQSPSAGASTPTGPTTARQAERRTTAWIGKSVFVKGDIVSAEDLVIDGRMEGSLSIGEHRLTVGPGAAVQG